MVPGAKQGFDMANMHQTYETYKFYNQKNIKWAPMYQLWAQTIDKPEE